MGVFLEDSRTRARGGKRPLEKSAVRPADALIHLALFSLMALFSLVVPPTGGIGRWALIVPLFVIAVYLTARRPVLLGPCLFLLFCSLFRLLFLPGLGLLLIAPIAVYTVIVLVVPRIRRRATWLSWGAVTPRLVVASLAVVATSSAALVLWYLLLRPDIMVWTRYFPQVPLWQLLIGGLGFALVNAVVEEVVYRGILWEGLTGLSGRFSVVLILQGLLFGLAHLWGVPNGIVGAGLAFLYGLMLGTIRLWARGLLMAVVTHVFADVVIFLILLNIIGRI
jgi:membrane protease YdiL (CAAX protease family)